eukprot:4531867-Amphidinium_carterae.1
MAAAGVGIARAQPVDLFALCAAFQMHIMGRDFNQLMYRLWNKQRNPSWVIGRLALMCGRLTQAIREFFPQETEWLEEREDGMEKRSSCW